MCISPIQLAQRCPYSRISAFLSHQHRSQRWLAQVVLANQQWCPSCWGCMTLCLVSASSHGRVRGLSTAPLLSCSGRGPNYAKTLYVRILKCQRACSQERNPLYKGATFKSIQKSCQAVCVFRVWPPHLFLLGADERAGCQGTPLGASDFLNSTSSSPVLVCPSDAPSPGAGKAAPHLQKGAHVWLSSTARQQHRGVRATLCRPLSL